jgi:hypothetical protein
MNITEITKLVTLVLAISVAGERLVALITTLFPWLAAGPTPTAPADPKKEAIRKTILMIITFLCCLLTAYLIPGNSGKINIALLALLASGGSTFWTSLLGYTKAVSDIKSEQLIQEKLRSNLSLTTFRVEKINDRTRTALLRIQNLTPPALNLSYNLNLVRI